MSTVPTNGMLIGRSTCGAVPVEVDVQVAAADRHGDLDRQVVVGRVGMVEEAVERPLGPYVPSGSASICVAQRPLGRSMSCSDAARTVSRPKRSTSSSIALGPEPRGGDLRLEVADDELRAARVLSAMIRQAALDRAALLLDLDRVEQQPLGEGVRRVDDAAAPRGERAEVEVVGRRRREADELVLRGRSG